MSIKGKLMAASLALLFIAYLVAPVHAAQKGQKIPKVFIPNKDIKLGDVLEGQDIDHTFIIRNLGEAELQIVSVHPG
jgi:hypothetical protein